MPTSLVEQEDGMGSGFDHLRDFFQMQPHRSGITARQHQAGSGAARRAHGAEDIGRAGMLIMRCPGPYRVAPSR